MNHVFFSSARMILLECHESPALRLCAILCVFDVLFYVMQYILYICCNEYCLWATIHFKQVRSFLLVRKCVSSMRCQCVSNSQCVNTGHTFSTLKRRQSWHTMNMSFSKNRIGPRWHCVHSVWDCRPRPWHMCWSPKNVSSLYICCGKGPPFPLVIAWILKSHSLSLSSHPRQSPTTKMERIINLKCMGWGCYSSLIWMIETSKSFKETHG